MWILARILGLPCRVTLRSDTRTHSPCVQDGVTQSPFEVPLLVRFREQHLAEGRSVIKATFS
ncbi:hypothetical protein NK6_396 [Bradyrhizobium diazoefficiens]|uniref:Uncharacterized protein n=1 Tax=Bradyrhizobium diazoefficiens TaxID=1355477 RepID=A0A0E4FQJ6_9BRAD|nr:hypothetical protein NK6_396 [Bradyrhizobium diazoefficiens]